MSEQLKYGPVKGEMSAVKVPMLITTGETFRAKSGRFVTLNTATGAYEAADAGDTLLAGWMEVGDGVTVASQEGNLIPAMNCGVVFRIPITGGTLTRIMFGKTVDIERATVNGTTLVQGADLEASGEDNLVIVGGDIEGNDWVDVMFNSDKITSLTGVV